MLNWIRKLAGTDTRVIHPPWRVGQYVTYYLERDGRWTSFLISVEDHTPDGHWILRGEFKTVRGECTAWFRSNPSARPEDIDPVPGPQELVRGSKATTASELPDDPTMQSSMALNLLFVRRMPGAAAALDATARPASYPCGITRVHRFITPGPGYAKCHDLNPRVLITGVACLSMNGEENPIIATSFGLRDPNVEQPADHDDFVDWGHCKETAHDSFSVSYPATWFLRRQPDRNDGPMDVRDFMARVGGIACACTMSVSIRRGPQDQLREWRTATLERLRQPLHGSMGILVPQPPARPALHAGESPYAFRLQNPAIDGLTYGAIVFDPSRDILAQIYVFGCVSTSNPLREATLSEMSRTLPAIVDSFRLLPAEA